MIKELKLQSEALWESIKIDLKFFSPIQVFAKNLAETDYSDPDNYDDITLYIENIDRFFKKYIAKSGPGSFYISPSQISKNSSIVKELNRLASELKNAPKEKIEEERKKIKSKPRKKSSGKGKIFIGHGRSKLWARVQLFLNDELKLQTLTFESESRTSETIVNILEQFLEETSFAILIFTAEDETSNGDLRARQNVIHEAGLFQGRLGFDKVIILKENKTEEFSNIAGLQYIPFLDNNIEQTFYELQRTLKKSGLIA
jgi:predicted nucleotide-binding protein